MNTLEILAAKEKAYAQKEFLDEMPDDDTQRVEEVVMKSIKAASQDDGETGLVQNHSVQNWGKSIKNLIFKVKTYSLEVLKTL